MASISLCNRFTAGKTARSKLNGVNLKGTVADLRSKIAKEINASILEIELIYCGKHLRDEKSLESYNIKPNVTVHILRNKNVEKCEEKPEPIAEASIRNVTTTLKNALGNPAYRNIVEKMLTNPDSLENIIAATPGLDKDPVAMTMLQDPDMLAIIANPDHIRKVLEAHPSLGQAATLIAAAVQEEITRGGAASVTARRQTYSLDQMSDEEDEAPGPSRSAITTSQLAAALASAGGSGLSGMPSTSGSSDNPPPSGMITTDFFREAMQQAETRNSQGSADPAAQEQVTQSQLQQLRDMGITDERVARQALQVTGGNIQAALELLFGDEGL